MLGVLKKRQDATAVKPAAPKTTSVDARHFLPPIIHYNAHTLLGKDGGVMQTIRISKNRDGLDYEPHDHSGGGLRECIRKALSTHIASDNVAICIHTLRKRRRVSFGAEYDTPLAAHVNRIWRAKHGWSHQYYNEVYITLVYEGQGGGLFDQTLLKDGATLKKNRDLRNSYVEAAAGELDLMMHTIMDELKANYLVHRLGVVERPPEPVSFLPETPIYYSEPMEFLSYLLNLREEQVPLPEADISVTLQSCDLIFGFNAMETKSTDGAKRFGALLSLKQYREVPAHTVDMLLQAPAELIISQIFHYMPGDVALKEYREQKELFEISGDEYSMQASGLTEMMRANKKSPTDFGSQQISIMVLVDELKKIDEDIARLQKAFSGIGLVCVREDIRLEEVFWSMFPGNFIFLRRKAPIPTSRIGGFAKLNRFASGHSDHTFWKDPVALLPTLVNSPYFFNFHMQDNGHTLWLDFNSFNDRMANQSLSFLLTQTSKLNPRVFYFDYQASAYLWFNKMGADYHSLHANQPKDFTLNPFSLDNDPRNLGFLTAWCSELINASENERERLKQTIQSFYDTISERHLGSFVTLLESAAPTLASRFSPWLKGGKHGGLFSGTNDDFITSRNWVGVDLTEALDTAQNAVAAFAYLLHRIIVSLDGRPTIIVLQHAFPLLQQPFFASRLESLLEMLKENNAMMVFCMRHSDSVQDHPLMHTLVSACASKVVVPDDMRLPYAKLLPALISENDQDLLHQMERSQGDILLKQGNETVALRINLDIMPDISAIFAGDIKTLISAGGPFSSLPQGAP